MEYAVISVVALAISYLFILFIESKKKMSVKKIVFRQSDAHSIIKDFIPFVQKNNKKETQLSNRVDKQKTNVILTDDNKAYWVIDNLFYVSEVINGRPDFENGRPIDTSNMSKKELDKMLFILDNLSRGDKNERGSTGN